MAKLPVSVIIPTLNEEKYLPLLLESIKNQTLKPKEVIVADASSQDNTVKIARSFGCKIVKGGRLATGRNSGAKAATQELLLFLDADMILPENFLELATKEIKKRKLGIAACFASPLSDSRLDSVIFDSAYIFMKLTEKVLPHGGAPCIFVKKSVHNKIKGFRDMFMNEDHDYVRRAAKITRFSYLKKVKLFLSVRRLIKEGRLKLIAKYTIAEMHQLILGPMKKPIYKYEFGNHEDEYL